MIIGTIISIYTIYDDMISGQLIQNFNFGLLIPFAGLFFGVLFITVELFLSRKDIFYISNVIENALGQEIGMALNRKPEESE